MVMAAGSSWALVNHSGSPNPIAAVPTPTASAVDYPDEVARATRAPSRTPRTEATAPQVTTAGTITPLPKQTAEAPAPSPSQVPSSWPRTAEPSAGPISAPKPVPHHDEPSPESIPETQRPDPPETGPPAPQKPAPVPRPATSCQGLLGCPQLPLDLDQLLP